VENVLTCNQAAERLGVNARTVLVLIKRGVLQADKVGRQWLTTTEHVEAARSRPDRRRKGQRGTTVTGPVTDESLPEEAQQDHRTEKVPAELDEAARNTLARNEEAP
jgi:excisionase family DNA binding protein